MTKRRPPTNPNALLALIAEKAAKPTGFVTTDARVLDAKGLAAKQCLRQFKAGYLFRERANRSTFVYFGTQELAKQYRQRRDAAKIAGLLRERPSFVVGAAPIVGRLAPSKSAEIVYTKATRYITRPTPVPRNQVITHSFIHSGMGAM